MESQQGQRKKEKKDSPLTEVGGGGEMGVWVERRRQADLSFSKSVLDSLSRDDEPARYVIHRAAYTHEVVPRSRDKTQQVVFTIYTR